jgi:F-type H+-transporting ATPase subunit epsilon
MAKLLLTVVSQEKQLVSTQADSITVPTTEGELTILPGHIPLFSQLQTGELVYRVGKEENSLVVSKGFMDIGPNNTVVIMADSAVDARNISLQKAQAAMAAAQKTMETTSDRRELLMAEASLKQAMWEIKVAQKTHRTRI